MARVETNMVTWVVTKMVVGIVNMMEGGGDIRTVQRNVGYVRSGQGRTW